MVTAEQLEMAEVSSHGLPANVATDFTQVVGTYALVDLVPGDYFLPTKVSTESPEKDTILKKLTGDKIAVSMSVQSLAGVLSNKLRTDDIVAVYSYEDGEKVKLLKSYPYIGVLGYTSGDMPLSYPEVNYDRVVQTIEVVSGMVDHVIIDCTSRITDLFTPAAIEMSDRAIGIFSADLRGVSYRKAQAPLLTGEKFRFDDHLIFAGVARPYYALDEMEHVFGHLDGILPWSKEIDRSATEGTVFSAGKYCSERYLAALQMVRNCGTGGGVIYGAESDEQSE